MHLDIRVTDPDDAEQRLVAAGATRTPAERETGFRVLTDPAGNPFCIVFGRSGNRYGLSSSGPLMNCHTAAAVCSGSVSGRALY
jgi:hypothetical protein